MGRYGQWQLADGKRPHAPENLVQVVLRDGLMGGGAQTMRPARHFRWDQAGYSHDIVAWRIVK